MIIYLIKSSLCLAIVLGVYKLLLEREKMLQFNRAYLIFGMCFSLVVPFMTIQPVVQTIDVVSLHTLQDLGGFNLQSDTPITPVIEPTWTWESGVMLIYIVIVALLGIRFITNLYRITKRLENGSKISLGKALLVLTSDVCSPHTFLKYIFLNKRAYDHEEIDQELITHELTHARHLHSVDILIVEIIRIVFWFNPLWTLYKRTIQLNHEFIADEAVIKSHNVLYEYQQLLISTCATDHKNTLASNFNFYQTKKRLTMMTRKSSKWKTAFYGILSIPLFAILFLLFSDVTAQIVLN